MPISKNEGLKRYEMISKLVFVKRKLVVAYNAGDDL
jgi:hypothetical protein